MTSDDLIGVTIERAAAIVGVSVHRIAAWERIGLVEPQLRGDVNSRRIGRVFGLDELVELVIVRQLEERTLKIQVIRRIVEAYRSSVQHPLRELRWGVEDHGGRPVVYVGYPDGGWVGGRQPHQGVMIETIDLEELRTSARLAAQTRPDTSQRLERRRGRMSNKLVFAGTRTPVDAVAQYLARGVPDDEILEAFPHLTRADLAAARESVSA